MVDAFEHMSERRLCNHATNHVTRQIRAEGNVSQGRPSVNRIGVCVCPPNDTLAHYTKTEVSVQSHVEKANRDVRGLFRYQVGLLQM